MDPVLLKAVEAIEELNFHNRKKAREREESVSLRGSRPNESEGILTVL